MAVRVHITVECPSIDDALTLVQSAAQQLDYDDSRSIVGVSIVDQTEPPF